MKVKELFAKDPTSWSIANQGVSSNNTTDPATLDYELRTFVCDGEYHAGLVKILRGYLDNIGKEQKAAWVSGFYGSGKSHLVKVLRYLWTDEALGKGETARTAATLPQDVLDLLKELSTAAKRGAGLHSAGGTLKAGSGTVRLRMLAIILQSVGLPEKLSLAKLKMDLRDDGTLEAIDKAVKAAGKDPAAEFDRPYTSSTFQKAYLASHPNHGSTQDVSKALLAEYPPTQADISIEEMLKVIRRAIGKDGKLPCTVVVLDEVQQFINQDNSIALEVQEIVEACSKQLDGRVLFVGTGQSALSDTPALQKLMGRFTIKVHLKDNDVEKVVRTVVLQKKESSKKELGALLTKQSGEITRQLKGTKLATRAEDDQAYVADYPILPVRRRFWEAVLHGVDSTGTAAQMRTQLRVAYEACRSIADREVGAVIPGDFLYDQLANDLVISGVMQRRFQEIVEEQRSKKDGTLRSRICGLVFLINRLAASGTDSGVHATADHLADLLTEDLSGSASEVREKVPGLIEKLLTDGALMDVDGELRLQTTEGAAWDTEFRRRRASLLNNESQIAAYRSKELSTAIAKHLGGISVAHGMAKVSRKVQVHHGADDPGTGEELTVWVRDGFQESDNAVIQHIQGRSVADATIHVLVPKSKSDELKQALASYIAADETINSQGHPTTQDGQEARASMVTRHTNEGDRVGMIVNEIIAGARVFLSGGQEQSGNGLSGTVKTAAEQVLQRLYPKFDMADSPNWATVWRKAKEGSAAALAEVGYKGDPHKHAVAAEVIRAIGAGKKGSEVVAELTAPPSGWPKDAVDATLAVLMQSGHLAAKLQGQAVSLAALDQKKIGQAEFKMQHPVLSPTEKLKVRKLFQDLGFQFKVGEEAEAASGFVRHLRSLAERAGGDPPAPEAPHAPELTELEGQQGNDLLFALFNQEGSLRAKAQEWKERASLIESRVAPFQLAERLAKHGMGLSGFDAHEAALASIRSNRALLDTPDPVSPLLKEMGSALRSALTSAHSEYQATIAREAAKLERHPLWAGLPKAKQVGLLARPDVSARPAPAMASDGELADALDACSLSGWRTLSDALPTRFDQILTALAKEAEPKAHRVALPSTTINDEQQLDAWLASTRTTIVKALKDGPVIL